MSGIGKHKLSDALKRAAAPKSRASYKTNVGATPDDLAEQVREAHERAEAKDAEASIRDRMVEIGRGNQQAGRQKSGHSD